MGKETSKKSRLSRRAWLLNNFDRILQESVYHRTHKENFVLENFILWTWEQEESRVKIDYVD